MEVRCVQNVELRALDGFKLLGYAAVFNVLSLPLGPGYREVIKPGAFTRSLQNGDDVRALVDHDPARIIGRTKAGTLRLREDSHGLLSEINLPDTSVGRDVFESVKRGDLREMSFGFRVNQDAWPKRDLREVLDVTLLDVSVVTFPAYPQTEVTVRGVKFPLGWYQDQVKAAPKVVPDTTETDRQKLSLMLELAQRI